MEKRKNIIILSTIIDNLCRKLYECIENDLLGPLQCASHIIAPYKSKGVEKASELSLCCNTETCNTEKDSGVNGGGITAPCQHSSGFGSSDGGGCPARKRARTVGGSLIDLNLPARCDRQEEPQFGWLV
ncbi:hypothetical protein L1049_026587 [Liquidambar formosana]|uniref:Ariadne domain-containing protein n=1 Tax=Liquidambar formosana TaxID=63359 RepID=A0AAP0NGP3_LIQFO